MSGFIVIGCHRKHMCAANSDLELTNAPSSKENKIEFQSSELGIIVAGDTLHMPQVRAAEENGSYNLS